MLYLGYHLSSVNGFEAMGREAISAGANTFAFFTRNPRGGKARALDPADITAYETYCKAHPEFPNNRTRAAEKFISETYDECLRENKFL